MISATLPIHHFVRPSHVSLYRRNLHSLRVDDYDVGLGSQTMTSTSSSTSHS